jgi:hypothetical protein
VRRRSGFIAQAVTQALDDEHRWELIQAAIGAVAAGDQPYASAINVEEVVRGLHEPEVEAARTLLSGLRIVGLGEAEGWPAGE